MPCSKHIQRPNDGERCTRNQRIIPQVYLLAIGDSNNKHLDDKCSQLKVD
jgi:hypothetical protein